MRGHMNDLANAIRWQVLWQQYKKYCDDEEETLLSRQQCLEVWTIKTLDWVDRGMLDA